MPTTRAARNAAASADAERTSVAEEYACKGDNVIAAKMGVAARTVGVRRLAHALGRGRYDARGRRCVAHALRERG